MSAVSQKIGFWSVLAIVIGSQIGSSVFISPTSLAPYGLYAILGFVIAGLGALALAYVFSFLCSQYPQTGGPHVYVKKIFGNCPAFFTGWTYWVISWVSSTTVIVTAVGYLNPLLGIENKYIDLVLEISLLLSINLLNLKGLKFAGSAEFCLSLLKFIPLILLPIAGLFYFQAEHIVLEPRISQAFSFSEILAQATLLTLWGFIGLETATAPAESVENPKKNIPKAMLLGTLCVALVYIINCVGIFGLIPEETLAHSKAPYVDAAVILFGGQWHLIISLISSIVCIGTLNAWVLTSGQIALGLAQDKLLPPFFATKNKHGSPLWSLSISCFGIIPLLILTVDQDFAEQIRNIIDISVTAFLFVYLICCVCCLKLSLQQRKIGTVVIGSIAALFCLWVIYETTLSTLLVSSLFIVSGIPMYYGWYKRSKVA